MEDQTFEADGEIQLNPQLKKKNGLLASIRGLFRRVLSPTRAYFTTTLLAITTQYLRRNHAMALLKRSTIPKVQQ